MRFILVLAVITGFAATPAMAHSIQGIWCHKDGRRMEIRDSTIILPRGTTTTGDFWRHYFDYVIPLVRMRRERGVISSFCAMTRRCMMCPRTSAMPSRLSGRAAIWGREGKA